MWSDLYTEWKVCFSLAWEAFCDGNTPVGAIITDLDGKIIAKNRNGFGNTFPKRVSHAEMNVISSIAKMNNAKNLILYTTLEPCVMCFSTIYVQKIGKLFFSCDDPHAGGTFLYKSNSYFSLRNMDIVQFDNVEYRFVNAVLNIIYEMSSRNSDELSIYLRDWNKKYSAITKAADEIYRRNALKSFTINGNSESLYNYIASYGNLY